MVPLLSASRTATYAEIARAGIVRRAELGQIQLVYDAVAVDVAEKAVKLQLAGPAALGIGRADEVAVRSAARQGQGGGIGHVRAENR